MSNEVRIVAIGDDKTDRLWSSLEGRAQTFKRSMEQTSTSVSQSTGRMKSSSERDVGAVGDSFRKGGDEAERFAARVDGAGSALERSLARLKSAHTFTFDADTSAFDGLAESAERAGDEAGERFTTAAEGRIRDSRGRFVGAGKDIGDSLWDGLGSGGSGGGPDRLIDMWSGAFDRLEVDAGMAGAGAGAAIGAGILLAGPIGQVAASTIVLGFGAGLAQLGATSALKSEEVKGQWRDLGDHLSDELADIDGPFEEAMSRLPAHAERAFASLKPELESSFATLGPAVERFAKSWMDAIGDMDLTPLSDGAAAVMDALGDRGDEIFGNLNDGLNSLGQTARDHAQDFASIFEGMTKGFSWTTEAMGGLADTWDEVMGDVEDLGNAWASGWGMAEESTERFMADLDNSGAEMQAAASKAAELAIGYGLVATGADALSDSIENVTAAFKEHYDPAAKALEASIKWKEAQAELAEDMKEGNMSLLEREQALLSQNNILREMALAESTLSESTEETSRTFEDQLPKLVELARGSEEGRNLILGLAQSLGVELVAGANDSFIAIDEMGKAIQILPDGKTVKVLGDIDQLKDRLADARARLDDPNLTKERRAKINAEIKALEAAVAAAQRALDSLRDKTVTVTVRQVRADINTSHGGGYPLAHGGNVPAYADGGNTRASLARPSSALALVGEAGPELVRLPYGSTVIPAGQTQQMLSEGDGIIRGFSSGGNSGSGVPSTWGNPGYGAYVPTPPLWGNPGPGVQIGDALAIDEYGNSVPPGTVPRVELSVVKPNDYAGSSGGGGGGGWPGGGSGGGGGVDPSTPSVGFEDTNTLLIPRNRPDGKAAPQLPVLGPNGQPVEDPWGFVGAYAYPGMGGSSGGGGGGGGWGGGGGTGGGNAVGLTINVYVQGSIRAERDLVGVIRNEIVRGGFGGVLQ
ncbi:hypothetical protein [Herbidospora daliensis]|uniref:hypothetical protein n=1 Tax=Herbidospora daliensis TaxID=295585 RepID=UPI000783BF21|nr:hypothetical protein [Herbidospora daliensis]